MESRSLGGSFSKTPSVADPSTMSFAPVISSCSGVCLKTLLRMSSTSRSSPWTISPNLGHALNRKLMQIVGCRPPLQHLDYAVAQQIPDIGRGLAVVRWITLQPRDGTACRRSIPTTQGIDKAGYDTPDLVIQAIARRSRPGVCAPHPRFHQALFSFRGDGDRRQSHQPALMS